MMIRFNIFSSPRAERYRGSFFIIAIDKQNCDIYNYNINQQRTSHPFFRVDFSFVLSHQKHKVVKQKLCHFMLLRLVSHTSKDGRRKSAGHLCLTHHLSARFFARISTMNNTPNRSASVKVLYRAMPSISYCASQ